MSSQIATLWAGLGKRFQDPGNMANAPASPPVQSGNWEYLQSYQTHIDFQTTNIEHIPPAYANWQVYPLNAFGLSGLVGGGITGFVPQVQEVNSLYYDPQTGLYVDLNQIIPRK